MQLAQRLTQFSRAGRTARSVVRDVVPERHPEPIALMRSRRQQASWGDGQTTFREERRNRDFPYEPTLYVVMQDRCRGHHARDDWCRLQMHQHVAASDQYDRVLARQVIRVYDGTRRSQGTEFHGIGGHAAQGWPEPALPSTGSPPCLPLPGEATRPN